MSGERNWRHTYRTVRFGPFDARSAAPLFLFAVHARVWTFSLVVVTFVAFWTMERFGLTFPSAVRATRAWFIGDARPAKRRSKVPVRVDYDTYVPGSRTGR